MVRKCDTTKHRKLSKKQRANKREKKQQQVTKQTEQKIVSSLPLSAAVEPEGFGERDFFAEADNEVANTEEPKPISPARRAFQDI